MLMMKTNLCVKDQERRVVKYKTGNTYILTLGNLTNVHYIYVMYITASLDNFLEHCKKLRIFLALILTMENLRNLDKKIIQKMRKLTNMKKSTVMKKDKPGNEGGKKHQRKLFLM